VSLLGLCCCSNVFCILTRVAVNSLGFPNTLCAQTSILCSRDISGKVSSINDTLYLYQYHDTFCQCIKYQYQDTFQERVSASISIHYRSIIPNTVYNTMQSYFVLTYYITASFHWITQKLRKVMCINKSNNEILANAHLQASLSRTSLDV